MLWKVEFDIIVQIWKVTLSSTTESRRIIMCVQCNRKDQLQRKGKHIIETLKGNELFEQIVLSFS